MKIRVVRNARKLFVAAVAASALAGGLVAPGHVHAQVLGCRSDPVILLSNGGAVDLEAGIGDSVSDVRSVTYVVHGPIGTKPLAIVNTDGLIGLAEHLSYIGDQTGGRYVSYTTVTTGISGRSVQPSLTVVSVLGITLGLKSTSGLSGQTLQLLVTPLL